MSQKKSAEFIQTIDPNLIPTRDLLMVRLICGATKGGVQPDRRKVASKLACRKPVKDLD